MNRVAILELLGKRVSQAAAIPEANLRAPSGESSFLARLGCRSFVGGALPSLNLCYTRITTNPSSLPDLMRHHGPRGCNLFEEQVAAAG